MKLIKPTDLNEDHFEFIKDEETLSKQVGMTLQERAADFMSEFPDKKMSRSRLQRIYKQLKIKRKKIKLTK